MHVHEGTRMRKRAHSSEEVAADDPSGSSLGGRGHTSSSSLSRFSVLFVHVQVASGERLTRFWCSGIATQAAYDTTLGSRSRGGYLSWVCLPWRTTSWQLRFRRRLGCSGYLVYLPSSGLHPHPVANHWPRFTPAGGKESSASLLSREPSTRARGVGRERPLVLRSRFLAGSVIFIMRPSRQSSHHLPSSLSGSGSGES